jgi:uncharacterized protein (TIGR00645 family)
MTTRAPTPTPPRSAAIRSLGSFIFWTRWLQAPLYIGLIVAQAVYVFHFWVELVHLVEAAFGNKVALAALIDSVGYNLPEIKDAAGVVIGHAPPKFNETVIMLVVLALIDVVMISNLLIMVIVGGYETFVSRIDLEGHPDQPEWLSHVNASVLKIKLATAIIGISSIHLLKTFINANNYSEKVLIAQTAIHIAFLLSAMAIAACDRIMPRPVPSQH